MLIQNILGEPIQKIIDRYIHIVDEQPTAFDADKVIEKLEDYLFEKYCIEGDDDNIEKIVKGGGVK